MFTYLIGVAIASLTHGIDWNSFVDVGILSIVSIFVVGFASIFFINALLKIKKITRGIRILDKNYPPGST